jgi:hypothetical protein
VHGQPLDCSLLLQWQGMRTMLAASAAYAAPERTAQVMAQAVRGTDSNTAYARTCTK